MGALVCSDDRHRDLMLEVRQFDVPIGCPRLRWSRQALQSASRQLRSRGSQYGLIYRTVCRLDGYC